MKPQIPIDPNDWTVQDWRDLWNGIEEIRARIEKRYNDQDESVPVIESEIGSLAQFTDSLPMPPPNPAPPVDNAHVAEGCEKFTSQTDLVASNGPTENLIRKWRWQLHDACGEIETLPSSPQQTKAVSAVSNVAFEMQAFLIERNLYSGKPVTDKTEELKELESKSVVAEHEAWRKALVEIATMVTCQYLA